ncbi:hypothetical protein B5X24_HaOG206608 [Helicoverpa armigera]|uniref:Uncharacterized protein n=1 Tax=Helicoverpa armigera TaxID=29058 RepID=A0A2W1BTX5_HELAM|nr:hypothetical protein B5X24_HaOG206608 [Helicoverpa armigera]
MHLRLLFHSRISHGGESNCLGHFDDGLQSKLESLSLVNGHAHDCFVRVRGCAGAGRCVITISRTDIAQCSGATPSSLACKCAQLSLVVAHHINHSFPLFVPAPAEITHTDKPLCFHCVHYDYFSNCLSFFCAAVYVLVKSNIGTIFVAFTRRSASFIGAVSFSNNPSI